eukprot:505018-Heterocapsa_arctica.AAC.1
MYKKPRVVQVHKASTELIPATGGILAGCGFAEDVKEEGKEVRYFVDDMVLFKESVTEIGAIEGIIHDLDNTKGRLTAIGQRLNNGKEQIFVPYKSMEKLWKKVLPDYKGKVRQAVVDL